MNATVNDKNFRSASLSPRPGAHNFLLLTRNDAQRLAAQGQRIRDLRALKRVSQQEAAVAIGVSIRAYASWELGTSGLHSDNLKTLSDYFETTPDYIEYGRNRGRHETPDISATLDIGAEILTRLIRLESKLNDLTTDLDQMRLTAAETVARDAEALARNEAAHQPTRQSRRSQHP